MNSQQEPQACIKCRCMPQDILMLACSHDLCLNCAAERLSFEMKKNKNANAIVCQICHEKTALDGESVEVLKNLIKPSLSQVRNYQVSSKYQDTNVNDRVSRPAGQKNIQKFAYDRTNNVVPNNVSQRQSYNNRTDRINVASNISKVKPAYNDAFQGISSKKTCTQHHEQEILYFCFDCFSQCICPECVIHGKHKDHDVKTIRKSQPLVKAEVDKYLDQYNNNVQSLLIRKNEIQKQIRSLTQQNNASKKQIQQAFDDLRSKMAIQQKQLLSKCDNNLSDNISELDKSSKQIVKKIDDLKLSSSAMSESTKKDEILFLNFYSRKYKQIQENAKNVEFPIPTTELLNNQSILSSVLDVSDQVSRLSSTPRPTKKTA